MRHRRADAPLASPWSWICPQRRDAARCPPSSRPGQPQVPASAPSDWPPAIALRVVSCRGRWRSRPNVARPRVREHRGPSSGLPASAPSADLSPAPSKRSIFQACRGRCLARTGVDSPTSRPIAERVAHRVGDRRRRRDGAAFAHALHAVFGGGAGVCRWPIADRRHFGRRPASVVEQTSRRAAGRAS